MWSQSCGITNTSSLAIDVNRMPLSKVESKVAAYNNHRNINVNLLILCNVVRGYFVSNNFNLINMQHNITHCVNPHN